MKSYNPANLQAQLRQNRFNAWLTLSTKATFVSLGLIFGAQLSTAQIVNQGQAVGATVSELRAK